MTEVVKSYNQPNFYTVPKKLFRALNERLLGSEYPCKHRWNLISKAKIATITGGSSAFKEMADFCDASGVPFEYMLCWTQLLLSCVEYEANPVLSTKWDDDFDGNWDFEISLCDNVYVPRKNPISLPRNDKLGRYLNRPIKNATRPISSVAPKLIPTDVDSSEEPKQSSKKNSPPTTKVTYTFGVQYFPASKIFKLRYSLYPQKHLWGLRFVERYRTFEDLIDFMFKDLWDFQTQDTAEPVILKEDESKENQDNPIPQSDDDFEHESEESHKDSDEYAHTPEEFSESESLESEIIIH